MTVIGESSHALFFNGVSDSIICPQTSFSSTGLNTAGARSSAPAMGEGGRKTDSTQGIYSFQSFTVEGWVTPDCGGVVAVKDDLFELRVGDVHQPGAASFSVSITTKSGEARQIVCSTFVGGSGVKYPTNTASFITADNEISKHTRELIHVIGAYDGTRVMLFVNGDMVAFQSVPEGSRVDNNDNDLFIGGRGGQYRGFIEALHWKLGFEQGSVRKRGVYKTSKTLGLWRFEEPIQVDSNLFYIMSNASEAATTLTLDATQVQTLYRIISGKSDSFTGTYTLPSLGNYQVFNTAHSGGAQLISIAHTTHNLLINPTCTDTRTGEANSKAPERVRLLTLNDAGTITVNSIHLDFDTTANSGARGILSGRTAYNATNGIANDSTMVLVKSDLLVDSGSGKPLQPIGLGSQAIDRTGSMVIDESNNKNHGFIFSRRISVGNSNNPYTVSAGNWSHGEKFQSGHTGRHFYSHRTGHRYLTVLPESENEQITRTMDGLADSAMVNFVGHGEGIGSALPINSQVSIYREALRGKPIDVVTSSTVVQVIRNGLVGITASDDDIIAIGGSGFDVTPFLLKGHGTKNVVATDDVYNLHLTPESESRVAILETGDSDFPYIEIHYNAVDLLGTTMGTSGPCLIVEKTVPHAGALINSKRVGATIASSISSGRTLHAPGGVIIIPEGDIGNNPQALDSHKLVGDNTGGSQNEIELDLSRLPSNYTPSVATDPANSGPIAVNINTDTVSHPSVYHRMIIHAASDRKESIDLGASSYKMTAVSGNLGTTSQSTHAYEVYDIIDNFKQDTNIHIILQPSLRTRCMQLSKVVNIVDNNTDPTVFSIEYLQTRGRVSSFKHESTDIGSISVLQVTGLMDDIAGAEVNITGDGSPNSHLIKELSPDAPVVTVTLGGPGQGAVNTKPTWDPSVLSRLGWSTRKDCTARVTDVVAASPGQIDVVTLNNESDALASWGTYCFPPRGRVYFESGANGEYYKTTAGSFYFFGSAGSLGTGRFINSDGSESDTYAAWTALASNAISDGSLIMLDPLFNEESVCNDGTTVNDRMFQSIGSVTHDYQLGTQYASTRALVEIPLFPQQFFEDRDAGIFPGPDNSMKLHLDATLTAHTWAPNPVGRRCTDLPPADREVMASYHRRWVDGDDRHGVRIVRVDRDASHIYIDNIERLPDSNPDNGLVRFGEDDIRIRRLYRSNGEWMIYTQLDRTNKRILITGSPLEVSTDFFKDLKDGEVLFLSSSYPDDISPPIRDDPFASSAGREFRRSYYHDRANVQTQGGNIDYGLRQYVSAVEFKAGPRQNPHLARIESGGAVITLLEHLGSNVYRFEGDNIPLGALSSGFVYEAVHENGETYSVEYASSTNIDRVTVIPFSHFGGSTSITSTLGSLTLRGVTRSSTAATSTIIFTDTDSSADQTIVIIDGAGLSRTYTAKGSSNASALQFDVTGNDADDKALALKNCIEHANGHPETITVALSSDGTGTGNNILTLTQVIKGASGNTSITENVDHCTVTNFSGGADGACDRVEDGVVNQTWGNGYAPGGLRYGDTVWMNMQYTNPHAIDGMFCKSRGVLNEFEVWNGFNGGRSAMAAMPRDSIPMENFLIGDTCIETARNFVQHINKTIEENYSMLGLSNAPTVAFLDPYLSTEQHARVLLYDVQHDREFIAFHDLFMQVQSSQMTPKVNGLDVASGFHSQIRTNDPVGNENNDTASSSITMVGTNSGGGTGTVISGDVKIAMSDTGRSKFVEGAYAHKSWFFIDQDSVLGHNTTSTSGTNILTRGNNAYLDYGSSNVPHRGGADRLENSVCSASSAATRHANFIASTESGYVTSSNAARYRFSSTFFDTPEGTRAIPAFLCLKGKRADTLTLTDSRLSNLPQWTDLDFIRRLSVDLGEIGVKEGVTDIEAAAREVVRLVNQAGALNGRSNQRRPADQYVGEGERFGITSRPDNRAIGVESNIPTDPTATHHHADFSATGSTHDPAPFWNDTAFTSFDRGSHMGYLRAHLGRVVVDADGNEGFSIVIHSTVPGASGRNFCTWLDNSRGQSLYRPQFLIGHGGRFRNFWCMPNEMLGENMHPAPMPINKDGRPFAPITTLRELLPQEEDADDLINNLHKGFDSDTNMDSVSSSYSDTIDEVSTGRSANTLNAESFEKQGLSETVVEGLRIGTQARSRINFGGLVASGIPGWAPDAGKWGLGENNNGGRFDKIYATTGGTSYSSHVPTSEVKTNEIGDSSLYGFRFVDHNGKSHTIRFVYRESGKPFVNDRTVLPNTIENETIVFFDDRDIGQGGFTIGKNMKGATYPMGPYDLPDPTWRGNLWRGVRAPENAYACTISVSGTSLTISTLWHDLPTASGLDALGWLGFPDSGLLLVTKPSGTAYTSGESTVLSYTGRTHNNASGTMTFTGVTGQTLSSYFSSETGPANDTAGDSPILISPALNQTSIITDELIAAAVEHAMTVNPNGDGSYFDCSDLYTATGRTYGELMGDGAQTAIHIKTFNSKSEVTPLRDLFDVRRDVDWGLYDGSVTSTASDGGGAGLNGNDHLGGLSRAEIDAGMRIDVGYLPKTVLNITTRYRGTNANTATPILVDSANNAVDVSNWRSHLRGELYTRFPGDHILPAIDGPCSRSHTPASFNSGTRYDYSHGTYSTSHAVHEIAMQASHGIFTFGPLGRYEAWRKHVAGTNMGTQPFSNAADLSFVEKVLIWSSDKGYALAQPLSDYGESNNTHYFGYILTEQNEFAASAVTNAYIYRWGDTTNARKFDGVRLAGNTYGEPLTYFRGASDSPDHSVPLYFGGGFSGVVMDVNDGTQNDYTEVMSHPYSSGPTGCAGLQNVGENMGSHAIIDTTAIMAMFPGTHALDQHRGEDAPPFANADAILHTDMDSGTDSHDPSGSANKNTLYGNTIISKPIPVVLRFAHPYARYDDAANEVAYVIFGPGQSAPKHFETAVEPSVASSMNSADLSAGWGRIYSVGRQGNPFSTGDTYFTGSALADAKLPNAIKNDALMYLPEALSVQRVFAYPFNTLRNWEPAYGSPKGSFNQDRALHGSLITNHFGASKNTAGLGTSHPYSFYEVNDQGLHGVMSGAVYRALYHMDGGCPAGGNWFDNAVRKNPPHPVSGATVTAKFTTVVTTATGGNTIILNGNATMFRVGALALTAYDYGLSEGNTARDVFVVDATRCQNSEEMAAIIAAAINSWPGEGNLKALGGTFLPSFQEASKQDRYAWTHVGQIDNNTGRDLFSDDNSRGYIDVNSVGQLPRSLPSQGWLRLLRTSGSTNPEFMYAYYYGYNPTDSRFYLGANYRTGNYFPEDPTEGTSHSHITGLSDTYQIFVWTQTGHHRWSNGAQVSIEAQSAPLPTYAAANASVMNVGSIFDGLAGTHVHFSGVVDAIDRTRPIGAIGWHGERYSYLNSLLVGNGVSAGLGAWHPALGFNPYGASTQCHSLNSPSYVVTKDGTDPPNYTYTPVSTSCPTGLHGRHYLVVSYEGELPIVAKADRDGIVLAGDYIGQKWRANGDAGTVITSHNNRHNLDRYVAWSNGGPHIDAQVTFTNTGIHYPPFQQTATDQNGEWAGAAGNLTKKMDTCLFPTGDLFFDTDINPGSSMHADEMLANTVTGIAETLKRSCQSGSAPFLTYGDDPNTHSASKYWANRSAARNFFPEHAVWKRMGGGNLCLPAPNARGLGAVPWVWRKVGDSYVKFGENIYGNVRFSFETTNASMLPIIQAQELAHPQLAEKHSYEVKNALTIPNEELQFLEMDVVDDTGQLHTIEGGSPFGVVIRDFEVVADRDTQGLAPALAGSGNEPNLKIRLPNPDTIPGNILVRSGFDRLQGYQHETMGSGGIQRPSLPDATVLSNFNSENDAPNNGPFWENEGWERIDSRPDSFPDSRSGNIDSTNPLSTSYEPHDRSLYFHITKVGSTYSTREPLYISGAGAITHDPRTFVSYSGEVLTADGTVSETVWEQEAIPDGRFFLVVNGFVVSYTNVSGSTFTGCVFPPGFSASNGDTIKPGFYIPAGTTRHFAARRLRDHAEVSGESPDKKNIQWHTVGTTTAPTAVIRGDRLTPMPLPRMGHHYVTPTMAMMPGHLAHPLYQRVYTNAFACSSAAVKSIEELSGSAIITAGLTEDSDGTDTTIFTKDTVGPHALMWFSSLTSAHKPSDIHGDGFTLMFETKLRFDGYGIADGTATCNSTGGHRIQLERGTNYKHQWNFPDPLEVGAYQIVIQPNLFAQQFMGNNANETFGATGAPTGTVYPTLTDQQVNTVIAVQWSGANYDLILAEATMADVRGCEIYLNEVILDIDPAPGQQFTSVPALGLFNPLGVNESTSGAFTRRSLPYRPNMFRKATPGYTVSVPWWSPAIKSSTIYSTNPWRKTEHYFPDDYYHFCRSTLGSVGSQITLAGYPTYYLDPYIHEYSSLTPTCTFRRTITAETTAGSTKDAVIAVTNNDLFPLVGRDYWNHKLSYVDSTGRTHTATYSSRGYTSGEATTTTNRFIGVSADADFWSNISNGTILRLTGAYGNLAHSEVYTKSDRSVATRNLPQLLSGTRDTNSLHAPDAFLCFWHYNLGRPMTYYSDSRTDIDDAAVDKSPYNHLPEHFEVVHYHEFVYAASDGPFDFRAKHWDQAGGVITDPNSFNAAYPPQAHTDSFPGSNKKYHFGSFWPGGSRFGAHMSTLTLWGTAAPGWGKYWDDLTIYKDSGSDGSSVTTVNASTLTLQNQGFGYRFGVRQPFNRPRWAVWSTAALTDPYANTHSGYHPGPFVQSDSRTTTTYTEGSSSASTSTATTATTYTGVLERTTNAAAMTGSDLKIQQVRYSHGRRMTKPYGCAVRNIINPDTVIPTHQGDTNAGSLTSTTVVNQRRNLAIAVTHYIIDWWGNTTGEEVRKFPVRGFAIRPSWDPEDAYRATDRTKTAQVFAAPGVDSRATRDLFDPATAKRVGDRGDGRGVRWPTVFNEDVLQSMDTVRVPTGHVLSHHTSETPVGAGYIRPKNTALASDELKRGISSTLDVAADDGLLKPEAMAGSNIEKTKEELAPANEFLQDPISRSSPRIGLDAMTVTEFDGGIGEEFVAVSSEAHSLHTDRAIGRRYIVAAGIKTDTRAVADYDLTQLNFSSFKQVMRLNMTHGLWSQGGTLILDLMNYMEPISDSGWGSQTGDSSNPYQTNNHDPVASPATGTITVADGDAAHGLTAGTKLTLTSTDGTIKDYFISDTNDGGVAHLSAVTAGATLKSTGSVTASLTSGATGISVGFNVSSSITQNAFLVLLKAAIEHANGHNGKITVSAVPTEANGNQAITVTQATDGSAGNVTITENVANTTVSGFSSGDDDARTNTQDRLLRLLLRPVRVLDHRHIEIFRDQSNALAGTAGGRYGVYVYDTPNARASSGRYVRSTNPSPTNPPYAPTYLFATTDYAAPTSSGPVIPGSEVTGFSNSLRQTVARIITTSNTLQHFRGDASRRQSVKTDRGEVFREDFSVQPRYTQSVYPGDKQNTSSHSGESDHTDNEVIP
jgi:hypothetical protein